MRTVRWFPSRTRRAARRCAAVCGAANRDGGPPCSFRAWGRIALVSYAPLRRWAAGTGVDPGAYDEQGPVFIHADDCPGPDLRGHPFPGAHRTVRRYSAEGHILGGRLVENPEAFDDAFDEAFDEAFDDAFDEAFAEAFADPEVALVHVRAVEYGCFLYEVRRA
jgi:hypothetical protein